MSKHKLLIFDLDGTLVNTDELIIESFLALHKEIKPLKPRTREELFYYSGPALKESMINDYPIELVPKCIDTFRVLTEKLIESKIKEYPDALDVIRSLAKKGYKLAINTNRNRKLTLKILDTLDYRKYFDVIITPDDVIEPKPSKQGVNKILDTLKIERSQCLFIGDNNVDFYTARNAGIDCSLVSWCPRKLNEDVKPIKLVSSYKELEAYLDAE